jgi:endonuclease III
MAEPTPRPMEGDLHLLRLGTVLARLGPAERHPLPLGNKSDPYDELIYILLTVMTRSQPRIDRAYDSLYRAAGGTWGEIARLDDATLDPILRPLGFLTRRKTQLRALARQVNEDHEGSLSFLRALPDDQAVAALQSLPGVGLKTAKCVLMYSLGREVLPVDIHVLRVAKRLGIVGADGNWAHVDRELEALVPPARMFDVHVQFVRHGREVCKSRGARCAECPLLDICPSGPLPPDRRAAYV